MRTPDSRREEGLERRPGFLGLVSGAGEGGHRLEPAADDRSERRLLVGEVPVEGADTQASAFGDLIHLHSVASLGKHIATLNRANPAKSTGSEVFMVVTMLTRPTAICAAVPAVAAKAMAPATA